jgi:hypothetical protein
MQDDLTRSALARQGVAEQYPDSAVKEKPKKCPVCFGWGYITCDCWPGDCICGYGNEECDECGGHGDLWPSDFDHETWGSL